MATIHPPLVLGPDDDGRLVSSDDFANADFVEPWKYERVDGRLVVMAPDGHDHQVVSQPWIKKLGAYADQNSHIVEYYCAGPWVRIGRKQDRIGDLGIYLFHDRPMPKIPDRTPDLIFEIVSPGQKDKERDYVKKRRDYHKKGIREYVVIDRFTRRVTVFTHTPAGYAERVLTPADTYTSPLLPGFALPLSLVFST